MCVCVALGCPLDGARMKGSRCMGGGGGKQNQEGDLEVLNGTVAEMLGF